MQGKVIKSTGSQYQVMTDDGAVFTCTAKGKLRLKGFESTNPLAVGDNVLFEKAESSDNYVITGRLERKNYIIRKSVKLSKQVQILAANIDHAYLIATIAFPRTSTGFIDRFLATCEAYRIPASIIFNKLDLMEGELKDILEEMISIYEPLGYACFRVSATGKINIDLVEVAFNPAGAGKINLIAGHSGSGKSTLINAIDSSLNLKTGELSEYHEKGVHTTTFAEMFRLKQGGFIIDTPGIREWGNFGFALDEIGHFFVEIRDRMGDCKFNNCSHTHEIKCAVKAAVESGEIHASRYESYLSMMRNEDVFR